MDQPFQDAHRSLRLRPASRPSLSGAETPDLQPCVEGASEPTEIWRPIPGYEGLYEVSDQGRVRSSRRRGTSGRILRPMKGGRTLTYWRVSLSRGNAWHWHRVHRLVLEAHIGPPPPGREIACHRNDNSDDNRLANLYWGSREDNECDRGLRTSGADYDEEAPF